MADIESLKQVPAGISNVSAGLLQKSSNDHTHDINDLTGTLPSSGISIDYIGRPVSGGILAFDIMSYDFILVIMIHNGVHSSQIIRPKDIGGLGGYFYGSYNGQWVQAGRLQLNGVGMNIDYAFAEMHVYGIKI